MFACLHAEGDVARLAECARHFSPHIEETSGGTVVVDLRGLKLLFNSADEIAAMMVRQVNFPVNIAIADDPDTAAFTARGIKGTTIIPSGQEARILASLPLSLLGGSKEIIEVLTAWGIRSFGELGALPPLGVAARLGNEGLHLQRLARGEERRQLRPIEDPLQFREEFDLDSPVELLEPLLFILSRLLNQLCTRLTARGLSTDEIVLVLFLENASPHTCTLRLPLPMRETKVILKLLQLELNARPPLAPILKVSLELKAAKPRTEQHNLFQALTPEPALLEVTLAKLTNLFGIENVGTPELLNTNRPDSFRMNRFKVAPGKNTDPLPVIPALALRRYRPPRQAEVTTKNQRPARVAAPTVRGKVVDCLGPWSSSGDWWKGEPWDQEEWDVVLSDGALYRLHENRRTKRWFVEGVYD